MTTVSRTQLKAGDKVFYHGATFQIDGTTESRGHIDGAHAYGKFAEFVGPSPVARANGKWVSGEIIPAYFGPNLDMVFQGNHRGTIYRED
jgi:hypothetical protein